MHSDKVTASMEGIAFFDLEIIGKSAKRISQIGVWFEESAWKGRSVYALEQFCCNAQYVCGHNILAHDVPYLAKSGASIDFLQVPFIDTLYLSALFFASKPYHRLVKDYRLEREHNDPVEDAKLAKALLQDCIAAYYHLPADLQSIYCNLLSQSKEFSAFFGYLIGKAPQHQKKIVLHAAIASYFNERICAHADLGAHIAQQPVQLAYVLALIVADDTASIIPPWLLHQYPDLPEVIHQLRAQSCTAPDCSYCQQHLSPVAGLRRFFGYPSFRKFSEQEEMPLQQQVVEATLRGESLLAIFPTGGGKSLTFQLPALMKGEANRGLTIVISPLQALMKDQVDVLRKRFEISKAIAIHGLLSPLERADAIKTVQEGGASLLYISPESLRSNTILKLLKGRHIERFVIDEAHCFSSWGQDFRTDYLYIGRFLKELTEAKRLVAPIPVSCFTATAKPQVVQDIIDYFQDQVRMQVYQTSAARKNLTYHVHPTDCPEAKLQHLTTLLQTVTEPAIVYVSRTKTAENLAVSLKRAGIHAAAFHGKMEPDDKIRIQNSFINNETDVMVATSAFGMGVDKDNVKMVVHYDISDSLENYLQEAGRAGRKQDMQAHCHLLFDEQDLSKHFNLLQETKLSKKEIGQIWKAIKDFNKDIKNNKPFSKSALEIARQAGWDTDMLGLETQVKSALAALEDAKFIRRGQNAPRIFARNILVDNVEAANKIIMAHAHLLSEKMAQEAIRIFQYLISRQETRVDYMAEDLGITKEHTTQILLYFKEWKLLEDAMALTAYINPAKSKKNSQACFQIFAALEQKLLEVLLPCSEAPANRQISLIDLNHQFQEDGYDNSSEEAIRTLLQYWESRHYIYKERLDAINALYKIRFRKERDELVDIIKSRQALAGKVARLLCRQNEWQMTHRQKDEDTALEFSVTKLKEAVESEDPFYPKSPLVDYEGVLLYLNFIGTIKLEGGVFVIYNAMRIERVENNPYKQYTNSDYAKLAQHYEHKIAQIHIMGAYAKKQLASYREALSFVDDYFQLPYQEFIHKYFRDQKGRLNQPITEKKFKEIFGTLSPEQLDVVKDKEHDKILVGAGPGSGKTRVLVHKIASLLTMEDIKTNQFLMLTFSRPAALEFKERLYKLVGAAAYHIDIFTYHGYAFRLLGKLGDLQTSAQVIAQAVTALRNEDIPTGRIKAKSVIVVDEYQDISQQEYEFLQVLAGIAEEVRIIVVGDDDQNIYEFRGSSVAFMRNFVKDHQAQGYTLTKNYRACANLVAFSNEFLKCFNGDRLKADKTLVAHQEVLGNINIHYYNPASSLITPLVNDVEHQSLRGTIAILTATNEESLLAMAQLRQRGIPAQLIASQEGFSLSQMLELKTFTHLIKQAVSNDLGYIANKDWQSCQEQLAQVYAASANLPLAQEVIALYERTTAENRFWYDWLAYLQQARCEDFIMPDKNKVFVSTMHKAKGKEFDHVFLMLKNYSLKEEAQKRVVYVAITRAKQSIHIHTDQGYFNKIQVEKLQLKTETTIYPAPKTLEIELAMQDVWLSHFKSGTVTNTVKILQAGMRLFAPKDLMQGLLNEQQDIIVKFSRKFQEKLFRYLSQGYTFHRAVIAYIVVWYCEDDGKEYRVILPKIVLRKEP